MYMWDVHDIVRRLTWTVSATERLLNIDGKCVTAAPHTRNQWLITVSYVHDGMGCTKWDYRDSLTNNSA